MDQMCLPARSPIDQTDIDGGRTLRDSFLLLGGRSASRRPREKNCMEMVPIPLVADLATALDEAGVQYCHWKSNTTLDEAVSGETDLDLLISGAQIREFKAVLGRLGFASASRRHVKDAPGTAHYFGYDRESDRFVHVHAHTELVLGHDRSKNYRLPIEEAYLASSRTDTVLPTPTPEFEYLVLVIRLVLKHAVLDEIVWTGLRGRRAGPSASERRELEDLQTRAEREAVDELIEEHLPYVGLELFDRARPVVEGSASLGETLSVARAMQAALATHARTPAVADAGVRVWRRISLSVKRRVGAVRGFKLEGGGALIAILGGDGAGKSTALGELGDWLGGDFDVTSVHLGKPPWSLTTYVVRATLKVLTGLGLLKEIELDDDTRGPMEYRRLVWLACQGRDRYLEYRRARRAADRGTIVLSDRFPHPALQSMDVPQIEQLSGVNAGRLLGWLARVEEHYQNRIGLPDLTFVLLLEPSESARRKTDEPHDYVIERSTEVWETDWSAHDVHVVDASRPAEEVAAEMKRVLWDALY